MGSITTGVGLISGIDTASLIDQLIALESRGKIRLQQRLGTLQQQQTALLDINARLLNLKTISKAFRGDSVFQSALATSSDDEILTATATTDAQPGTFKFIVKQLVSTSQKLSSGFADKDTTPLNLDQISFEFGRGVLAVDRDLSDLNAGGGVARGKIVITDKDANSATIDLTDVTTVNEVLSRINDEDSIDVTATVDGDHLVITDNTGGSSNLIVANASGYTTATDLGIVGNTAGTSITGTDINTIGASTSLESLNDGNGVLTRDNVTDFRITTRSGRILEVDLGRVDAPITTSTKLSELNNGDGVTLSDDDENMDIKFVARDGTEYEVNLTGITTVGGLITRVTNETSGHMLISVHADGDKLTVTDTVGGAGLLKVLGAGTNTTQTADDLGILEEDGVSADSFDGEVIPNTITDPPVTTIQGVIDRINNALDTGQVANGGHIVAALAADGVSIELTDTVSGAGNLIVASTASNPYAAAALGIETAGVASDTLSGTRLIAALNSVMVTNLNGGSGLSGATSITVSDRNNNSFTLNNLDTHSSLSEIIDALNQEAVSQGVDVAFSLNNASNGLLATDSSGGSNNLTISGDAATALGIADDVAATTIRGTNLQLRYVDQATKLEDLNYGRGIGEGTFRLIDGFGEEATVTVNSQDKTLYDIILEINSRGLALQARVNDNGDGIIIEEDLSGGGTPFRTIEVESVSGTTAKDLNILGEADDVSDPIHGSYERVVDLETTDNLGQVVTKINAAGIPVKASVLNAGGGATPYRLNLTSSISGRHGELIIDAGSVDLGFTSLSAGADAKVFFGADDPEDAFLVTSGSNTIEDVLDGVTIDLKKASTDVVTLTIDRDTETIIASVKDFVAGFNDAMERIRQYDFFDVDTEERGVLLGNPTTSRVEQALLRVVRSQAVNVDTQYQYLREVGLSIGTDQKLTFDQDKFLEAYENDPTAVENLFAAYEATTSGTKTIVAGVTITNTDPTITSQGVAELFVSLLEDLTNTVDGTMTLADEGFQDQIDLTRDRIEVFDERLEAKRARLQAEFAAMEVALARLQSQSNALNSIASNLNLAQNRRQS